MGRARLIDDVKLGLDTAEDVLIYQRAVKDAWRALPETAEKLFQYSRKKTLKRCLDRASVPTVNTIKKYSFTKEELEPIFEAALEKSMNEAYSSNTISLISSEEESDS